ncbi:MAG: NUDIX domain-containing protein [Anaerolineales bacterium]|nr:NUDIX domain-containing protein [Anaerolineales bacterium]
MFLDIIFQIWRRFSGSMQWRLLWLFNSKFMVSVAGIVYDKNDHILLQRHRHWVPDVWGLPGGIVKSGEILEKAFSREVLEETGLVIANIEMIRLVSGYDLRMEVYFRAKLAKSHNEQIIKIQEEEIIEARFFSLDELPSSILQLQKELIQQENGTAKKMQQNEIAQSRTGFSRKL